MNNENIISKIHDIASKIEEPGKYLNGLKLGNMSMGLDNLQVLYRSKEKPFLEKESDRFHHCYVLNINIKGKSTTFLDHKPVNFNQNSALLIPPFCMHTYLMTEKEKFRWLVFTFEHTANFVKALSGLNSTMTELAYNLSLKAIEGFIQEDIFKTAAYFNALLVELSENVSNIPVLPFCGNNSKIELISKVNSYINENVREPLDINTIASEMGISPGYLCALFKEYMDCSIGAFVRISKIRQAQRFLLSGKYLVSEVAFLCGYTSLPVFTRAFKNVTGQRPTEFIKQASRLKNNK